ncbi:hypothetical protein BC567DRAFT_248222 [Phyllosticta citribraziliensis]
MFKFDGIVLVSQMHTKARGPPRIERGTASTRTKKTMEGSYELRTDLMVSDELANFDVRYQHVPIEKRAETKAQFVEHYRKELAKDILHWQRVPTDYGNKMWKAKVGEAALYERRFPTPGASQQAAMELPEGRTYWVPGCLRSGGPGAERTQDFVHYHPELKQESGEIGEKEFSKAREELAKKLLLKSI